MARAPCATSSWRGCSRLHDAVDCMSVSVQAIDVLNVWLKWHGCVIDVFMTPPSITCVSGSGDWSTSALQAPSTSTVCEGQQMLLVFKHTQVRSSYSPAVPHIKFM